MVNPQILFLSLIPEITEISVSVSVTDLANLVSIINFFSGSAMFWYLILAPLTKITSGETHKRYLSSRLPYIAWTSNILTTLAYVIVLIENPTLSEEIQVEGLLTTLFFTGLNQYGYYYFLPEAVLEVQNGHQGPAISV